MDSWMVKTRTTISRLPELTPWPKNDVEPIRDGCRHCKHVLDYPLQLAARHRADVEAHLLRLGEQRGVFHRRIEGDAHRRHAVGRHVRSGEYLLADRSLRRKQAQYGAILIVIRKVDQKWNV